MTQPLSPAAQAVLNAANGACSHGPDDVLNDSRQIAAAALRAAGLQMIKTDDLEDMVDDIIRGAERSYQAGWLHRIAAELEGRNS